MNKFPKNAQYKVVLIDDDDISLFLNKTLLEDYVADDNIKTFNSAKLALAYLDNQNPEETQCLILLDINMPIMNGWDFLLALESHPFVKNVKVVLVTSSVNRADRERAISNPLVIDLLRKPLSVSHVKQLKDREGFLSYFR